MKNDALVLACIWQAASIQIDLRNIYDKDVIAKQMQILQALQDAYQALVSEAVAKTAEEIINVISIKEKAEVANATIAQEV